MSTVLWLHVLADGQLYSPQEDLWAMYRYSSQLDAVCKTMGLIPLSLFHDTTDAQANLAEVDAEIPEWEAVVREKGNWRNASELFQTLVVLRERLQQAPRRFGLISNRYTDVMAELDSTLATLEPFRQGAAKAHLAVVL